MTPGTKDNLVGTFMVSKCPVCDGKGRVPYGFYSIGIYVTPNSSMRIDVRGEVCRSCYGQGIIIH